MSRALFHRAGAKPLPAEFAKGTPEPEARGSSVARGESEAPGGEAGNAGGGGPSAERGGSAAPSEAGAGKKGDLEDEKMSAAAAKERNLKRAETIRYPSVEYAASKSSQCEGDACVQFVARIAEGKEKRTSSRTHCTERDSNLSLHILFLK